ncbi:MAG: type II toxin-antitoxin system PemK/MazF family toxin [Deltaproteobacteria bacterium]|nr:type II toxin-antitoxin system PemK/MazF family toxin [Deltaproteobacteria bacterium]MBI3058500.1 type II toxin-antitoxin system PemK/MazF family toxin [Deltaproteobacteria bacterium]
MQRGEIWLINLDPTIGSEIRKTRPAVIVKANGHLAGLSPKISLFPCRLQDPNNQLFICMKAKGQ